MRFQSNSARIEVDGNMLVYYSSYDPGLVAALKSAVPASDRKWDPARKAWQIAPAHAQALVDLTHRHLGIEIQAPTTNGVSATRETRILDVRYIGATRDRGNGQPSAFAWIDGQWGAIFPEKTLREWFNAEARPDEHPTLYATLGVPNTATDIEIKSAYRRLARMWHPDVCKEPDAHEQFIRIQRAYEVLIDPHTRSRYDAGLALAASVPSRRDMFDVNVGYRPPLRCGLLMVTGIEQLGRFIVDEIHAWEDIVDIQGRTLVTSWVMGADAPTEEWYG
jgi:hypothetical protein